MKLCPNCQRAFVDSEQVCPLDDGKLAPAEGTPPQGVGRALGPYLLVCQLGEGGMGTIYIGRHTGLGRYVAIKVLRPELTSRKDNITRFFQEAHTINRLRHPNIVESIDLVEDAIDGAYCVLELLRGPDLKTRLAQGPLPLESAIHIGVQLADALGAVHGLGVVHRDLKPDNLILLHADGRDDIVKLIDFGAAQMAGAGDRTVVGTAAYMAPEQASADAPVDRRADVYSLGVILFEMAVGRHPFPSATDSEYLIRHAEDKPPRPSKLNPRVPPELDDIILRCLSKRSDDRFTDAAEVASALRLVRPRKKSHAGAIVISAFLVGGVAAAAYVVLPSILHKSEPEASASVAPSTAPAQRSDTTPAPVITQAEKPTVPTRATPAVVEISITSAPSGATVYRADETVALGVTPCTVSLPRSDTPTHMRFELAGYSPKIIEVPISASLEINAKLVQETPPEAAHSVRLKKSSTKTTPDGSAAKSTGEKKLQREGTIDPFAK